MINAGVVCAARSAMRKRNAGAFRVIDFDAIRDRVNEWTANLPRVAPFYAIKCNPDREIVSFLASLGIGFDVASFPEIDLALTSGSSPSKLVYANPIKSRHHVEMAGSVGVDLTVVDGVDEIGKLASLFPKSRILIRLSVDDSSARCRLGQKFGCRIEDVPRLLGEAKRLDVNVVGVSFHVGSGNPEPLAWRDALAVSRRAFDLAADHDVDLSILDIGGGFTSRSFGSTATVIRESVDAMFPMDINVIAEPGRFMTEDCETLFASVIGRRGPGDIFVDESLYGSFNSIMYDGATLEKPVAFSANAREITNVSVTQTTIWGQTCDGLDCIMKNVDLPELHERDWVAFPKMGAYTSAAGSSFNGFSQPDVVYVGDQQGTRRSDEPALACGGV